jgi:hypothetical protein
MYTLKLNPLQRLALNGRVLAELQVPPSQLSVVKDIQDKLQVQEAVNYVETSGTLISLKADLPSEQLDFEVSLSRAESEVLFNAINGKNFTIADYEWLWPIYKILRT